MSFAPRATYLPYRLPEGCVLARTENLCVALDSVACWPEHFSFEIAVFSKTKPSDPEEFFPFPGGLREPGERFNVQGLRLGIQFSDGRTATNLITPSMRWGDPAGRNAGSPFMTPQGGTGGGGGSAESGEWRYVQRIDLWPLPPAGKTIIILDWPDKSIYEVAHELPGSPNIEGLGKKSIPIW
ncbi:hypothetical protein SAMN04489733_1014 [Amycolatopsis keratiniphila]|nr:hypothetical protein SAMN04489733_1014 [Amycolatopsis keratiniphila]